MKRIYNVIKNNNTLIANFSYLSILKIVTMFLPLFTYPYLISTLGLNNYGLIIYSQAIIGYFVVIINFGFGITTTREISRNRDNIHQLSIIITSTYLIKLFIFLLSLIVLFILRFLVSDIYLNFDLFLYTLLWLALYEVFFPSYYFQGVEKMKYITLVTLISRVFFFVCVFIFINDNDDYILFPILNFLGSIVAIIVSLWLLWKDGIRFIIPKRSEVYYHIKSSYIMGIAVGSNTLKSNLNIVLIKNILSLREVAVFDLASKLISIGITLADLISQTVFPKMAKEKNKRFFRKLMKLIYLISFLMILGYVVLGKFAVVILSKGNMPEAYQILLMMSIIVPIYSIGTMLGRNCLNVYGFDKQVLYSMIISSLVYVVLYLAAEYIFNIKFNLISFVFLYVLSFLVDTLYRLYVCKQNNLI